MQLKSKNFSFFDRFISVISKLLIIILFNSIGKLDIRLYNKLGYFSSRIN